MNDPIKELTIEERITWGHCPVCGAAHGEHCHAEVGLHMGVKASGERLRTGDGVHMARLQAAPMKVKLVPAP